MCRPLRCPSAASLWPCFDFLSHFASLSLPSARFLCIKAPFPVSMEHNQGDNTTARVNLRVSPCFSFYSWSFHFLIPSTLLSVPWELLSIHIQSDFFNHSFISSNGKRVFCFCDLIDWFLGVCIFGILTQVGRRRNKFTSHQPSVDFDSVFIWWWPVEMWTGNITVEVWHTTKVWTTWHQCTPITKPLKPRMAKSFLTITHKPAALVIYCNPSSMWRGVVAAWTLDY